MKSNFIKKNQVVILTIVLVCFLSGLGLFYFNKQKQERKRQKEEEYYAQLLLKYTQILFYPHPEVKPEPEPKKEETKKEVPAEKTEPSSRTKQPEGPPSVFQRIESLLAGKKTSQGYVKELAMLFRFSMEMCENLDSRNRKNFTADFFSKQAELLLENYNKSVREIANPAGFTAEENTLRQEVCGITDGKVSRSFQPIFTEVKDEKVKTALVKYLAAYLLATRSSSQIAAEISTFSKAVPVRELLEALSILSAEKSDLQNSLDFCQDIVNCCKEKECIIWAFEKVGDLYRQSKMNNEAIEVFRMIVRRYPEEEKAVEAQEKIIEIYSQDLKLYANAINECMQLIKISPGSESAVKARFTVGQLYYQANDYKKAVDSLNEFVQHAPKSEFVPDARMFTALSHIGTQDYDKAIKQLQYVVSKYDGHALAPRAQFLIGYCYLSRQDFRQAEKEFRRLIRMFPESTYTGRAQEFLKKMDRTEAL